MIARAIEEPGIRLVTPADLDALAGVLGRAFATDPVFAAILPDEAHRRRIRASRTSTCACSGASHAAYLESKVWLMWRKPR